MKLGVWEVQGGCRLCETFEPLGLADSRERRKPPAKMDRFLLRQTGVAGVALGFDTWSVGGPFEVVSGVSQICLASNPALPKRV